MVLSYPQTNRNNKPTPERERYRFLLWFAFQIDSFRNAKNKLNAFQYIWSKNKKKRFFTPNKYLPILSPNSQNIFLGENKYPYFCINDNKMTDQYLTDLHKMEEKLRASLEKSPIFKRWDSLKKTIDVFQNGEEIINEFSIVVNKKPSKIEMPPNYTNNLTWQKRIWFAIKGIEKGFISEIADELLRLGSPETKEAIEKRVSTITSAMKREGILDANYFGKRAQYFIK